MAVRPKKLEGISPHRLAPQQLEAARADLLDRTHDTAQRVRLPLAGRARTGAPQQLERQIDFFAALESNRKFRADHDRLYEATHAG